MNGAIQDKTDFCRECRGYGSVSDGTGGKEPCDRCMGTGYKTVLVSHA